LEFSGKHPDSFVTVVYDTGSKDKIKGNLGCVVLDDASDVKEFEEKPEFPKSTLAILAIYMFKPEHITLLREFKESGGNLNSPSNIIPFLMKKGIKISAFVSKGRVIDANGPEEISQVAGYPSTSNQSIGLSSSGSPL
jgi:glucose-1-phosphate adenylyltransferase